MKKTLLIMTTLMAALPAFAAEGEAATGGSGMFALAAAVAISVAALGGALAQGRVGATAMEGIARNPQAQKAMFVPMIIALALIESLVIYALVIAFQLVGKL
jgi:F-type H+-transporting ATPase subunit c